MFFLCHVFSKCSLTSIFAQFIGTTPEKTGFLVTFFSSALINVKPFSNGKLENPDTLFVLRVFVGQMSFELSLT